jgi:hypothetical protein
MCPRCKGLDRCYCPQFCPHCRTFRQMRDLLYEGDRAVGWLCPFCNRIVQAGPAMLGNEARR